MVDSNFGLENHSKALTRHYWVDRDLPQNHLYELDKDFFQLEKYDIFINNLQSSRGVIIYIKNTLNATNVQINSDFTEHIWANINLKNQDSLLVVCLHRSPSSSRENFNKLTNVLYHVKSLRHSHLLLMGDLNFKEIDWVNQATTVSEDHISTLFLENVRDNYFFSTCHRMH